MDNSSLFDEKTFYAQFTQDLLNCKSEVIIESPFVTSQRMERLWPILNKLLNRGVKIIIITRDPKEHLESMEVQSESEIKKCERLGIEVLLCVGNHHRKLAILDRKLLWEGSLNILSQTRSREIMRRIEDRRLTIQMFEFLNLAKFL